MKNNYPRISLGKFCQLLGVTRQAYYEHFWNQEQLIFGVIDKINGFF